MNFVRLLPVILSYIILAAHFSRAGFNVIAIICLAIPILLFVRKLWVVRLIQVTLVLGSLEWIGTLYFFTIERQTYGQPWARLAIILGIVALFTVLSVLVFRSTSLKKLYKNKI